MIDNKFRQIKEAIKAKYAFPGGYPLYIVMSDGAPMCIDCARKEFRRLATAWRENSRDGWRPVAADINYENQNCFCCHCNQQIESAYGVD